MSSRGSLFFSGTGTRVIYRENRYHLTFINFEAAL